jgi:hypothetical protein
MHTIAFFLLWVGSAGQPGRPQSIPTLEPYVSPNRLYALRKPPGWRVSETAQQDFLRVQVQSPDGQSGVDMAWQRRGRGPNNALGFLAAYRELLSRAWPDVSFSSVYASRDNLKAVAAVTFHNRGAAMQGKYYFEADNRGLSAQGFVGPAVAIAAERGLLLNVMASVAFIKKDSRPEESGPQFWRPQLVQRVAPDRSLSVKIPADWNFLAGGGKVVAGANNGGPGIIFTSLEGNPMVRGVPITQGVIASRYLPPPQTLSYVLQGFGHRNIRIEGYVRDANTTAELMARLRRQGDAQDVTARWTSSAGPPCEGAFKVINAAPSMTGLWFTIIAGIWAPERDAHLYLPALEEIAASFSINDQYAREYIRAGLARLRDMERQTAAAIQDLNRAREQNQLDWEERQRRKEFSDSKWDDYRRGNSYWVSDLEGGKVYATDSWGTRDTVTGDYYEGRGYNWVNFEGENPRYRESMREISSYELRQMR